MNTKELNKQKIFICTMGTKGDILPFTWMAEHLVRRGYDVTIFSNSNWEKVATETGAHFKSIAPADPTQSGRDDYIFFIDNILPTFRHSFEAVKESILTGARPWLIYRNNMLGFECAVESLGLFGVQVVLQPSAIQSVNRPPWPWTQLATGRWRWLYKYFLANLFLVIGAAGRYRRVTNTFRRSVGARPVPLKRRVTSKVSTLMLCPKWFAQPQTDWPPNLNCIGFPDSLPLDGDEEMQAFLRDEGRPLVFTPGTGVTDIEHFFQEASKVCAQLSLPGVFLSSHVTSRREERILCRPYVDLAWLLKSACALIHHGGIGTTAQAIRAGVPQVIIPGRFDQPDNAIRVAQFGLGVALMEPVLSCEKLTTVVRKVLEDECLIERVQRAAAAAYRENAIEKVIAHIESRGHAPNDR